MAKKRNMSLPEVTDKEESLKQTLAFLEKEFGKGIIQIGGSGAEECEVIPTGALTLDIAIEAGGIPRGRVTEIYGPEASGKTTLTLSIAAQAQKTGGKVAFIDAEHALDPKWAKIIGVDVDKMIISQPDCGEQALQVAETLAKSNAVDLIIIDSVPALVPKAELEGQIGDTTIGAQARMMSQALRRLVGVLSKSNTAVIFINQIREKIGVMFGSPETTSGGKALKYYASLRLDIRKTGGSNDPNDPSVNCRVKIIKNKIGRPFRQAEFVIHHHRGIDTIPCVIDVGVEKGVIAKNGGNHYWHDIRMGHSKEATVKYLTEHPEAITEIEAEIYEKLQAADEKLQNAESKSIIDEEDYFEEELEND